LSRCRALGFEPGGKANAKTNEQSWLWIPGSRSARSGMTKKATHRPRGAASNDGFRKSSTHTTHAQSRDRFRAARYCSGASWTIWRPPFSSFNLLTYSSGRCHRMGTFNPMYSAMSPMNAVQFMVSAFQTGELSCNFLI